MNASDFLQKMMEMKHSKIMLNIWSVFYWTVLDEFFLENWKRKKKELLCNNKKKSNWIKWRRKQPNKQKRKWYSLFFLSFFLSSHRFWILAAESANKRKRLCHFDGEVEYIWACCTLQCSHDCNWCFNWFRFVVFNFHNCNSSNI